jgi:ABC-type amino acid transport system permease subunit
VEAVSGSQQVFVQVMATVLIGTFIAYSVDLRNERDEEVDVSNEHRALRTAYKVGLWWVRLTPLLVTFALIVLMYCAHFDALGVVATTLILWLAATSVTGLGVSAFMARVLRSK